MTSDWKNLEQICQTALELKGSHREAFLKDVCGNDGTLRQEVESLLAYENQSTSMIDRPALQVVAQELAESRRQSLIGRQFGAYKIISLLGAGGMGEVYRAIDTRLDRTVAIKLLSSHLSTRPDLRKRFEREARAISNLNHPHICTLYDIGQEEGFDYLVMEYLQGEILAQRVKKGPLPLDEVLQYALQIGDALAQAHQQGVIHRDLKPGNIMLTTRGAKLLDFGLAKLEAVPPSSGVSSTLALAAEGKSLTAEGIILGTLEYMAPEQLEGKEVDARSDVFSFGTVIYEMATGRKAFSGDSKASVIVRILTGDPVPVTSLQPLTPPKLEQVVEKCLRKEPAERWQSAAEVTSELQEIAESNLEKVRAQKRAKEPTGEAKEIESEVEPAVPMAIAEPPKVLSRLIRSRAWRLSSVGILLAVITGSLALWRVRQESQKPPEKPKEMSFKPLTSYGWDNPLTSAAISPDGKYLAFCSNGKLFIQVIRSGEKRSIPIPDWFQPAGVSWFPDGMKLLLNRAEEQWIQVKGETNQLSDLSLWSVSILGSTPQKIVDHALSASVSPDGSLVAFSRFDLERQANDIWFVSANGEGPRRIRTASESQSYFEPVWSTNGQRLFYIRPDVKGRVLESCDVRGEKVTTIFSAKENQGPWWYCWAPDGRILFTLMEPGPRSSNSNLWEIMVDEATGKPMSEARPLTHWSSYNLSFARDLSITADGKQLVLLRTNAQSDVYVAEAEAGGKAMKSPRRLTLEENDDVVWDWAADSRAVLFESYRNGNGDIFKQNISQTEAEAIVTSPEEESHPTFSPDRAFILYLVSEKRGTDATRLMRVPVGGGPPEQVLKGEKLKDFSCAREAKLCVVVEEVDGKPILTTFDPVKGRGEKLPMSDFSYYGRGILSPQGRLIEKMKFGPNGPRIRVRSLKGGSVEEIRFKNLDDEYGFSGWSLDGKGIYLSKFTSSYDFTLLYAGLDGHSQVFWKRGSSPGHSIDHPIRSPDGRYFAFTSITAEMNAWLLENF